MTVPVIDAFNAILKKAQELGASDVHISAGGPYRLRLKGQMMGVTGGHRGDRGRDPGQVEEGGT
jgi:Tfp pilus assembly pilus retraction ATPase PilT